MTKIKICGLKRPEDISYVNKYLPDYIGFVFAQSKRMVDDATALQLKRALDKRIKAVGVFVNEPIDHITALCRNNIVDLVQLHGEEDERYIRELRQRIPNEIIKAIRVKEPLELETIQKLPCNHILFDTYIKEQYGGSGLTFNRELIPKNSKPFFLAGGLNEDNILKAIEDCHPYCVDISSGVEAKGIKDEIKIKEIIKLVRSQDKVLH
ncbi:phosphoribosylanthranilate isomerase [Anaerocolumna sedimenticola]|uniref:N-(5'-phosphoribosyl)anthranilate isomerase n=1 Tax=Anaerocolumna sedimenticola TaxID=2696063 RepID=A0A6P1TQ08_9FIRM|nr:phosphoribosylanthranilate isomerase [Anaerocolumna sedimenticola]QHQ61876.1 phosphoribosylanthranilate isomerase [Anaerocolumna sedimenticola]